MKKLIFRKFAKDTSGFLHNVVPSNRINCMDNAGGKLF